MTNATAHPQAPQPNQAQFAGLNDWIEVFKSGTHTDMKGNTHTFGTADLDQMVANVELGKPPAVIGHPKHDGPAYAWGDLKREGDSLYAKFTDINPAFEAGVQSGAYRNRSVAIVQDKARGWRVRHIGWLGAMPPAIDGLKPIAFGADDAEVIEFAQSGDPERDAAYQLAWGLESAARLLRGFREYLIQQSGIEAADKVLPSYSIDSMQQSADGARAALAQADTDDKPVATAYSAPEGENAMPFTQEDIDRAREEGRAQAEAKAQAQFASQGQELSELRAARINDKVGTQVNEWVSGGLVTPAEAGGMKAFMATLEEQAVEFAFAASDNTEVKQTPAAWFAAFMAGRKPLVKLGRDQRLDQTPPEDVSGDAPALAAKASEYIAEQATKGIVISVADAVAKFSTPQA